MYKVSTDPIRPAERMAYWQDAVSSTLLRVDCTADADFTGCIRHVGQGNMSVAELSASPHTAARQPRRLRQMDDGFAIAFLQLEGVMRVVVDDQEQVIPPGGMFFYDAHEPNNLSFPNAFRHLFIRAPWQRWGYADRPSRQHSFCTQISSPLLSIARAASIALLNDCTTGDAPAAGRDAAIEMVVNLLSETVASCSDDNDLTPAEQALTRRFHTLLADRLQDPTLSVEAIASELGVSTRYLNRVLTRSGESISARILRARLTHCARDLRGHPNVRVGDIAWRWGFNDLSYFSRAFKAFHGASPREYRQSVATD